MQAKPARMRLRHTFLRSVGAPRFGRQVDKGRADGSAPFASVTLGMVPPGSRHAATVISGQFVNRDVGLALRLGPGTNRIMAAVGQPAGVVVR